ncbi:hypothetical protein ACLOJK_026150 [Asimina triloba]
MEEMHDIQERLQKLDTKKNIPTIAPKERITTAPTVEKISTNILIKLEEVEARMKKRLDENYKELTKKIDDLKGDLMEEMHGIQERLQKLDTEKK